jgi:16S rRNA (cytosine1402-N4)-methyltransferase
MNPAVGVSAAELIAGEEVGGLAYILGNFGEIQRPMRVAHALKTAHAAGQIPTTTALVAFLRPFAPPRKENQFAAQVFQALRMAVNDELPALRDLLTQCEPMMPEGVISYHSLEDRLVKHFIRSGNFEDAPVRDLKGQICAPFTPLFRRAVVADALELESNPRSRSARLRVGVRTAWNVTA